MLNVFFISRVQQKNFHLKTRGKLDIVEMDKVFIKVLSTKEVLQYKVLGKFQNHTDEQGKIDTYWLSMEDMVACMGYGTLLGVPDLIARYERKYIEARSAHTAPVFADLRAQQRALSEA